MDRQHQDNSALLAAKLQWRSQSVRTWVAERADAGKHERCKKRPVISFDNVQWLHQYVQSTVRAFISATVAQQTINIRCFDVPTNSYSLQTLLILDLASTVFSGLRNAFIELHWLVERFTKTETKESKKASWQETHSHPRIIQANLGVRERESLENSISLQSAK